MPSLRAEDGERIMSGPKAEDVIEAYTKLRDKRSELKRAYEAEDSILKDKMRKLDAWLLGKMAEVGTTQLKGNGSVAFISTIDKAKCDDWGTFWQWLADNARLDMLEKRVANKSISEYLEEFGELPPGISVTREKTVNVRKA
jgi:hypothetical protein